MARSDESIKKLFKNKENFADLFNATVFQGKQVIKADKLMEINTEDIHIEESNEKELDVIQKYRDLKMQYEDQVLQIILGCEDQSKIDYSMPIRTMLYDALAYTKQQNDLELKKSKNGTFYRGKMTKKQKVLPVLSVVFYYGEKKWNAGRSLHDVIKWPKNLNIKNIIPDYKMNLIWAYGVEDIEKFSSDLQCILYLLKYKQDEDKLEAYMLQNEDKLKHMNQDTHNAIIALMGSEMLREIEREEGDIRMESKALLAIKMRGQKEGEVLAKIAIIQKKIERGDLLDKITDDLMEDEKIIRPIYKAVKEHPQATKEEIYEMLKK